MSAENFLGDVYSHWGTMPSTAMSRDHRKVPGLDRAAPVAVPVGRTFAHRSMLGGPSEQDAHKNMYSGTRACTPGAGAYCPEESQRKLGIGFGAAPPARQLRRPTHPVEAGAKPRGTATMGTEVRRNNAHLAAHRYAISPRPGPGDHNPNHNSKSTIAAGQFVPRDAPREDALKIKLSSVNWRLRSLRSGLKDLDRLPADKRRVVLLETKPGGEYSKLKKRAAALRGALVELEDFRVDEALSLAASRRGAAAAGSARRPRTVPMNYSSDRFFHPLASTSTPLKTPGPGAHGAAHSRFGEEGRCRSPTFTVGARSRSRGNLHMHSSGGARDPEGQSLVSYWAAEGPAGPGEYSPPLVPPQVARDPLAYQTVRRSDDGGE